MVIKTIYIPYIDNSSTNTDFYSDLFDTKNTDNQLREKLLRNIAKKISDADRTALDKTVTMEELEKPKSRVSL